MYHLSPDGLWRRCIAEIACPYGTQFKHSKSRVAIAQLGGGSLMRHGRIITIKPHGDGYMTVSDTGQIGVYTKDDKPISLRQRLKDGWTRPALLDPVAPATTHIRKASKTTERRPFAERRRLVDTAVNHAGAAHFVSSMSENEWFSLSHEDRKQYVSYAATELLPTETKLDSAKYGKAHVSFAGFVSDHTAPGRTRFSFTPQNQSGRIDQMQISLDPKHVLMRNNREIMGTLAKQLAHVDSAEYVDGSFVDHDHDAIYEENLTKRCNQLGIEKPAEASDAPSELSGFELQAKLAHDHAWYAVCPEDPSHIYYRSRKPSKRFTCGRGSCRTKTQWEKDALEWKQNDGTH